jgi:hypothetical protein
VRGTGKWIAAAVVAVIALVVAFFALRGDSTNALADAAGRMHGENMRAKLWMDVDEAGEKYSVTGQGVMAADNSSGELDMTVDVEGDTVPMFVRNLGDRFWFRSPRFRNIMPPGKRWVASIDRSTPTTSLTPSEFASFLSEADDVDEISDNERVQGQPATHYSGMVDVEELADEIGGESQERLEAAIDASNPGPGQKVGLPVEAWISRDGMPLRMRVYTEGENTLDATVEILEYGVEVDIEAPPESTVIDEAEFNRLTG